MESQVARVPRQISATAAERVGLRGRRDLDAHAFIAAFDSVAGTRAVTVAVAAPAAACAGTERPPT